jgi:uncharacterized metal-binding protein
LIFSLAPTAPTPPKETYDVLIQRLQQYRISLQDIISAIKTNNDPSCNPQEVARILNDSTALETDISTLIGQIPNVPYSTAFNQTWENYNRLAVINDDWGICDDTSHVIRRNFLLVIWLSFSL